MIDGAVQSLLDTKCTLGEGAFWDCKTKCFWFVDIKSNKAFKYDPKDGALKAFDAPVQIGFIFPIDNEKAVVGLKTGIHILNLESNEFILLQDIEPEYPNNRLNDACIGPDGALWFGTMDDGESDATGAFYRFDGSLTKIDGGISITNGPCFSPCGKYLYTVDTLGKLIFKWEMLDGVPVNKAIFADLNDQDGYADGPVCDADGNVWIGLFFGWGVRVYSAKGELLDFIKFPVSNITKVTFGGDDLKTVYVTTARAGLSESDLGKQPLAGNVFTFRSKIPGFSPVGLGL